MIPLGNALEYRLLLRVTAILNSVKPFRASLPVFFKLYTSVDILIGAGRNDLKGSGTVF